MDLEMLPWSEPPPFSQNLASDLPVKGVEPLSSDSGLLHYSLLNFTFMPT